MNPKPLMLTLAGTLFSGCGSTGSRGPSTQENPSMPCCNTAPLERLPNSMDTSLGAECSHT